MEWQLTAEVDAESKQLSIQSRGNAARQSCVPAPCRCGPVLRRLRAVRWSPAIQVVVVDGHCSGTGQIGFNLLQGSIASSQESVKTAPRFGESLPFIACHVRAVTGRTGRLALPGRESGVGELGIGILIGYLLIRRLHLLTYANARVNSW